MSGDHARDIDSELTGVIKRRGTHQLTVIVDAIGPGRQWRYRCGLRRRASGRFTRSCAAYSSHAIGMNLAQADNVCSGPSRTGSARRQPTFPKTGLPRPASFAYPRPSVEAHRSPPSCGLLPHAHTRREGADCRRRRTRSLNVVVDIRGDTGEHPQSLRVVAPAASRERECQRQQPYKYRLGLGPLLPPSAPTSAESFAGTSSANSP